jgi:restriction system protein
MDDSGALLVLLFFVGLPLLLIWWKLSRRAHARRVYWAVIRSHLDALARARIQLVREDRYGRDDFTAWNKELAKFSRTHLRDDMDAARVRGDRAERTIRKQGVKLDAVVFDRAQQMMAGQAFHAKMSPWDFEEFCAQELRRAGWSASLTKGSGDQGVDIVAERDGTRLVVQCKLYNRPVGNKAVQEAVAAKLHVGAHVGAVVTNATYTPSASQLAATTATLLLHHSELPEIAERVGRIVNFRPRLSAG